MNRLLLTILSTSLVLSPILYGQSEVPGGDSLSLWGMIKQGGWAMYPLGLCSLTMFFLILHCWRETQRSKFIPSSGMGQAAEHLSKGQFSEAIGRLRQIPTVLSRAMSESLSRAKSPMSDKNREKVEATLVESLEGEENNISQWINYLNVIAAIAPMIGLLGTVSGMIGAFQTISSQGMGNPDKFAGNIGEALITTATGLVIGIPSMVFYFVMRNRLNNAMLATIQSANSLLDFSSGDLEGESETP
jgi:biopolymer transport protein ExbB